MLNAIKSLMGLSGSDQRRVNLEQNIRRMGGDPGRLSSADKDALIDANSKLPAPDDLDGWLDHVNEHGLGVIAAQQELLDRTGAFDEVRQKRQAREDARTALLALDKPVLNAAQDRIIESLPKGPVRDAVLAQLRTAVVLDPVLRPATPDEMSFCGGLPIAPRTLKWPHGQDADGNRRPCHFLCQIAVTDIPAELALRRFFPDEGALYFFEPEFGTEVSAPLVQHHTLEGAAELAPPEGLGTYTSLYHHHLIPELKTGWLHEARLDVPGHSIRPKWPLSARLQAQAPATYALYDEDLVVPEDLLTEHGCDRHSFVERTFDALNAAAGRVNGEVLNLDVSEFSDFPHVWGAVQRLLERFLPVIETTEAFYLDRIATNQGEEPGRNVPAAWIGQTEDARAAQVARTMDMIEGFSALRQNITAWMKIAEGYGPAAPMSERNRRAFLEFWEGLGSEQGIPLEDRYDPRPGAEENCSWRMKDMLGQELVHSVTGSLCTDLSTLPEDFVQRFRDVQMSHHLVSGRGPIQMLGHVQGIQGSEAPLEDLLLLQLPYSRPCDWYFGDLGATQFWMRHEELQTGAYEAVTVEQGS